MCEEHMRGLKNLYTVLRITYFCQKERRQAIKHTREKSVQSLIDRTNGFLSQFYINVSLKVLAVTLVIITASVLLSLILHGHTHTLQILAASLLGLLIFIQLPRIIFLCISGFLRFASYGLALNAKYIFTPFDYFLGIIYVPVLHLILPQMLLIKTLKSAIHAHINKQIALQKIEFKGTNQQQKIMLKKVAHDITASTMKYIDEQNQTPSHTQIIKIIIKLTKDSKTEATS
jgi:hypothetical protein